MATDCQKEKKMTDFTTRNLDRGRMGASSEWVAVYINTRQYSAHPWHHNILISARACYLRYIRDQCI